MKVGDRVIVAELFYGTILAKLLDGYFVVELDAQHQELPTDECWYFNGRVRGLCIEDECEVIEG